MPVVATNAKTSSNVVITKHEDDGWGDDWGEPSDKKPPGFKDLDGFDYDNTDLNKLSDYQLNRHKQKME